MDDEIKIRVSDIVFALKKNWKLIVATTIAGMLFGLVLTAMSYVQSSLVTYNINGSFAISARNELGHFTTTGTSPTKDDYYLAENMVAAVRYVLGSRLVVEAAIEDEKLLAIGPADIQHNLTTSQYGTTQILEMNLQWGSPEEGIEIWNAIVNSANRYIPKVLQLGTLVIINEPHATQMGVSRAGPKLAIMLSGLGVMAGMGFAVISMLLHPTLNNLKDVDAQLGLETLGIIPQSLTWSEQEGRILARSGNPAVTESYSAAAYILRNRLGTKEKHHCLYVTSATSKEGKSVVAANIAIQLSLMECHTLLIDFDTRNPDIAAMFLSEIDYAKSINALYRGEANEYDVINHVNGYLDLMVMIPEHNPIALDATIEELFTGMIEKYDFVVINASPVGVVSETLSLNQVTNKALFVIGYDSASMSEIEEAIKKLDKSGARIIGCIVNGAKSKTQDSTTKKTKTARSKVREEREVKKNTSWLENREQDTVNEMQELTDNAENSTDEARKSAKKKSKVNFISKPGSKKKRAEKTDKKQESVAPAPKPLNQPADGGSLNIMEELIGGESSKDITDPVTMTELLMKESEKSQDSSDQDKL